MAGNNIYAEISALQEEVKIISGYIDRTDPGDLLEGEELLPLLEGAKRIKLQQLAVLEMRRKDYESAV